MTKGELAFVLLLVFMPVIGIGFYCLALLERCERHLRALHVQILGPIATDDRTEEGRSIRRDELGLNDGYPQRQRNEMLLHAAIVVLILWSMSC